MLLRLVFIARIKVNQTKQRRQENPPNRGAENARVENQKNPGNFKVQIILCRERKSPRFDTLND
jgi:hypothetical protein